MVLRDIARWREKIRCWKSERRSRVRKRKIKDGVKKKKLVTDGGERARVDS